MQYYYVKLVDRKVRGHCDTGPNYATNHLWVLRQMLGFLHVKVLLF